MSNGIFKKSNIVGIKSGEEKQEIEGAKFFVEEDNLQTIVVEDDKDYTFVIEAFDEGSFSFSVSQRRGDKDYTFYYDNVSITPETKASFELKEKEEYLLNVDIDGDGNIDKSLEPDFENIVEIDKEEELDYVKKTTIKTDFKESNNLRWVWIAASSVVLLLVVFLFLKKRIY